jgi:DNA-binding transcriptional regulator YdaS (Cro superfamily)
MRKVEHPATLAPASPLRRELFLALAEAKATGRANWQIAAEVGIHPATLSRIVFGRSVPSPARAAAIAAALGRPVEALFPDLNEHEPAVGGGLAHSQTGTDEARASRAG